MKNPKEIFDRLKNRYKKLSLRQIIQISFTFTALIATLLIGLSFYGRFSAQVQETIREKNQYLIEQVGNTCTSYLQDMMKISDSLYYTVIKKADLDKDSITDSFRLLYDTNKESIESIALFSASGELLEASPAATIRDDIIVTEENWYDLAVNSKENMHFATPMVSHLFSTDSTEYSWVIPFSRSVQITRDNKVESGVLLINIRYQSLKDVISNILLGNEAYLYMTDSRGEIIYHPSGQLINSGLVAENNLYASTLKDGNYKEEFEGSNREITVKTIGYTGWKIVGVTPSDIITLSTLKSNLFMLFMVLFLLTVLIVINSYISKLVSDPIRQLESSVKGLEEGKWDTEIKATGFYEVQHLGKAIEKMVTHIKKLMNDIVKEHEDKRKTELTALQNQINPHFLYNTLDIIVWMIENGRQTDAVRVVTALARFFRISLSRGKNIITVKDEIEHVRNYLTIQEMRYKNRFSYSFDVDSSVEDLGTIKLILQPIVENAIYHAMEFMDGDGEITIKAYREEENLKLIIRDNGCGMTEETASRLLSNHNPVPSSKGSGIGILNVQQRIQLLFGDKYGLNIESEPDCGTTVTITMPAVAYTSLKEGGLE